MLSLVDPYAASTGGFVHRCCTQFSIKRCLQPAHACRPPLRTCVVARHAPRMAPCPRRVPLAMRTPASRRPHGDRPVALRSPLKDRKATARHGNALHPREGAQARVLRLRALLEPCRRERPRTGASTSGDGAIACARGTLKPSKNHWATYSLFVSLFSSANALPRDSRGRLLYSNLPPRARGRARPRRAVAGART